MASSNDAQATIAEAVQSARYNEAVVVTVNDDDDAAASPSSPREIVLVACLDPTNGGIVWKDAAAAGLAASDKNRGEYDAKKDDDENRGGNPLHLREDPGIVRHLRTKRWALPMLNDRRRNRLYDAAVRQACRRAVEKKKKKRRTRRRSDDSSGGAASDDDAMTIRILDIGSGTGLLAMMGAKHGLDALEVKEEDAAVDDGRGESLPSGNDVEPRRDGDGNGDVRVTSVEMASAMARLARITVSENGLADRVAIVERHSADPDFLLDDSRFERDHAAARGLKEKKTKADDDDGEEETRADVCTSELLESGLLGEGVLPSLRDAWARHLRRDAEVVPRRARVLAALAEGLPLDYSPGGDGDDGDDEVGTTGANNAATAFLGPEARAFERASGGVRPSTTARSKGGDEGGGASLLLSGGGVVVPLHADAVLLEAGERNESGGDRTEGRTQRQRQQPRRQQRQERGSNDVRRRVRLLSDPVAVLDFDFASGPDALPPPAGRSVITRFVPTDDGVCHGVMFWWELDLRDAEDGEEGGDDELTYSTEPIEFTRRTKGDGRESQWQDHWQQCLFLFGDGSSSSLTKGAPVDVTASHDDASISFSLEPNRPAADSGSDRSEEDENDDARPSQRRRLNEDRLPRSAPNRHITPGRALQLNDSSRLRTLRASIQHCIETKGREAPVLDLSEMGLCALMAAVSGGATNLTSLESGTLATLAATVAQVGNDLPRPGAEFRVIQALAEHIKAEHVAGGAAEIVVAEPYHEILEGWHLQEALNHVHLVRSLKRWGAISPSASSVPARTDVMACVLEFDEFASAYGPVGDPSDGGRVVAGLRHSAVNFYRDRCSERDLPMLSATAYATKGGALRWMGCRKTEASCTR